MDNIRNFLCRICCGDIAAKKEVEIIAEENTLNESRDEIINVTSFGNTPKLEPGVVFFRGDSECLVV